MKINQGIFKEYDVRGVYPDEINKEAAYKIGGAFVKLLKVKNGQPSRKSKHAGGQEIAVGRDKRKSSKPLAKSFIEGIVDAGIDVIDIGETTTPQLYFATGALKTAGGAMITASHNPKKYNGIKFAGRDTSPIGGKEIGKAMGLKIKKANQKGKIKQTDIAKRYTDAVYKNFKPGKKTAINHSFDFDGDRLMVFDKNKKQIRGDIIGGIISDAVVKKGDIVVYDLRCSKAIPEYLRNKGIKAVPSRVGSFNIKKLMREKKAVFGMELAGHYYFKKFHYAGSPDFCLRILTEQINKTGKSLKELAEPFMKYYHSGVMDFKTKDSEKLIAKLKKEFSGGAINFTDGITVEFSNWWFNLRPSNTEPLIRLVTEANSKKLLSQKKKEITELIL